LYSRIWQHNITVSNLSARTFGVLFIFYD